MKFLFPGSSLGVIGGGQLGRMFTQRANEMGYNVCCYTPEKNSPCEKTGANCIIGEFDDLHKLEGFLKKISALTFEFENIPSVTLDFLDSFQDRINIFPNTNSIRIAQNRFKEKSFFQKLGLNTVQFSKIDDNSDLKLLETFPFPAILKTNQFGYDGKGQFGVNSFQHLQTIISELQVVDHILEEKINFDFEISVICARFSSGSIFNYLPSKNVHKNSILDYTIHPANLETHLKKISIEYAQTLINELDYVGVLGLEMFVRGDKIICNEFAPRPHNSGHFTMNSCRYSQFDLQLMSLTNLYPETLSLQTLESVMKNIIGEQSEPNEAILQEMLSDSRYYFHSYQKEESRKGRKMGHINFLGKWEDSLFSSF
ncbi:MAG: 5-(carboxyamino)imidazole ribonucleotide synthase [Leptospiraceae bacterium]|nr:5-(carboxyamino)imidazole ribonucleotide synthase [Leptospiraceae bacterium]